MSKPQPGKDRNHAAQALASTARGVEDGLRLAANTVGRVLGTPLKLTSMLPGLGHRRRRRTPGASPGIEQIVAETGPSTPDSVRIQLMEYGDTLNECELTPDTLDSALDAPLAEGTRTRWVNVDGLSPHLVARFKDRYGLHTLAAEDVLHVPQRPKAELYGEQLYVVARMIYLRAEHLHSEQVSYFLLPGNTLLTFQEDVGDVWEPVRQRISNAIPRIRQSGADYLLYALLDAQVDHGFPLLEHYGDQLEWLETQIMGNAEPGQLNELHRIKRELALLRRVLWPMRDLLDSLCRDESGRTTAETRTFLRDVYDHSMQLLDIVETYREMTTSLNDLYMNAVSQRMNEIMKTLTIMASIFIPITFIAGVYGMNFEHMPELSMRWAYPSAWLAFIGVAAGLLVYFRRKRWF